MPQPSPEFFQPDPVAEQAQAFPAPAPFMDTDTPQISGDEDFNKIKPGQKFKDPAGKVRTRAYELSKETPDEDFAALPEGAPYIGPDGKHYTKPVYQSVGFTAQMLHDMAPTEESKEKALRTVYGKKVNKDREGLYVDDDGVIRRPGARDLRSNLGAFTSEIGPAVGMGFGTALGAGVGTLAEPGGGTALGGFGGMVLGSMAGRQFNNLILTLAGVNLTGGETLSSLGWEGAGAAGGEVIGKTVAKIPGAARAIGGSVNAAGEKISGLRGRVAAGVPDILESAGVSPERARSVLGVPLESAQQMANITERGGRVPPSVGLPEAPMLHKIEEFNAVFDKRNRFLEANRDFYEKETARILEGEDIGIKIDTPLTAATKKVSSQEAGQLALASAQRDQQMADAVLENARRDFKAMVEHRGQGDIAAYNAALERVTAAQKQSAEAAERFVKGMAEHLRTDVDATLKLVGQNEDPSAAVKLIGAQFDAFEAATRLRAGEMYGAAHDATRGAPPPNVSSLAAQAEAFLRSLPEGMRARYPTEIADLARLVDREVEIPGVRGPRNLPEGQAEEPISWAQLHRLRSWFRHGIDYNDMTPDMRAGALKHFEKQINAVLHDPNAPPQLKAAAGLLDQADNFYKSTIPFLNDEMVRATMKSLESGAGVNPSAVARILFDPERTAALRRARGIIGENGWRAVEAAHVSNILDKSKTLTPGEIDFAKFAAMVEQDVKSGLIETGYSPALASRMRQLATQMGQFEGSLPIKAEANDTLSTIMRRGAAAKAEAEELAKSDPISALSKAMSQLDKEFNQSQEALRKQRRGQPLGFLHEPSMNNMAVKAADRILGSQDLIMAAANQFGRDSKEFQALQKVYVHRWFQRPVGKVGGMRAELGGEKGMTEEIQALMFPGATRSQMLQLIKDAEFLFGGRGSTDFGGSMAAAARVLNPSAHMPIPKLGGASWFVSHAPGVAFVHRLVLGKVYATVMDAVSHPNFMNWLAESLKGSPQEREMARTVVRQRLRLGGWIGAGVGQVEQQRNIEKSRGYIDPAEATP